MTVASGTRFDHYEVIAPLGKGGMGEVLRARDTRLNREVAIKVLPAEFAQDADRLRRFEQEAMATSALNHPNILTVYDFGTHEGNPYLVMELLEGEELRAQLDEGALPVRKVIDYAGQIVAGLAAAHAKGIVHRDLKPENLFVTKDGRVKILDFGLAKLTEKGRRGEGEKVRRGEEDETLALPPPLPRSPSPLLTAPGTVMGTVAYMSPEQVRGEVMDHRSDLFSFGLILYEMLRGERAFQRQTMPETMTAILKEDPPELTNAKIPSALDKIVRRCLGKMPELRFQTASDLGFALSTVTTTSGSQVDTATALPVLAASLPVTGKPGLFGNLRLWMITTAVLLLGLLLALPFAVKYLRQSPPAAPTVARFTIAAPEKATTIEAPELSPDGRHLVFAAFTEGRRSLWLRPLDSLTAQPLPGTEGVFGFPFWSPDSRSLVFAVGMELKKLDLGGAPQTLCRLPSGFSIVGGGTWNRDGVILFSGGAGIYRVPATGGEPSLVLGSDQPARYRWPVFLPDGRHFLVRRTTIQGAAEIHLAALDRQETTRLLAADSQASYANGHLLFAHAGAMLAAPFDASSLKLTGEPFEVADKVRVASTPSRAFFSVSDNGSLIYDPNAITDNQQLTWVDRAGKPLGMVGSPGEYEAPRLSHDGKRLAVGRRDPQSRTWDIYVIDLARGAGSRLTFDRGNDGYPVWSPDDSHIAWRANRDGAYQIYQKLASGVGPEELLLKADVPLLPGSWSADGRFLLYARVAPKTGLDLWALPLAGDRQPALFLQTPFSERDGCFSPDGRWTAYTSDDQGRLDVFVQTFPASGGKWQISINGGQQLLWRSDGKELYYLSADGKLMAVEVKPGDSFEAGAPRALFDLAPVRASVGASSYAVTAAGDRFLFITAREEAASLHFTVVTNWAAEAKK